MMAKELAEYITHQVRAKDMVAIFDPSDATVIVWDYRLLLFLKCRNSGRLTQAQRDELGCWLARMHSVGAEAMVVGQRDWPAVNKILKRRLLDKLIAKRFAATEYTSVFGMDWSEQHRMDRLRERLAPIPVLFPLAEPPYVTKREIMRWLNEHGVRPPRLYNLGFDHNNCGGGCVKAGQAHWAHLLRVIPERYTVWEFWEESMRRDLGKDISIMRRNGATLTLEQFRQEREAGMQYERDLWGGCGCFADGVEGL